MVAPIRRQTKTSEAIKRRIQADGWLNLLTGIGTGRDKIQYSEVYWQMTTRARAEHLFAGDDLGGKVASIIPLDGTREGITWKIKETGNDTAAWLTSEFERLKVMQKLYWCWCLARVYGGSLGILSVNDGKQLDQPLNQANIVRLNAINPVDRWQMQIYSEDMITDPANEFFGQPEFYTFVGESVSSLRGKSGLINIKIHRSRVIRFDGVHLPERLWRANNYWHDSVFGRLYEPLRNYTMVHNSIAAMLQEFNQPVFKMQGMAQALSMDQDELVVKKLHQTNLSRSVARAIAIDSEDSFENISVNTSGIDTLVQKTIDRLTAASNIPHTRLMGESPGGGIGANGRSELTDYYDFVGSQQEVHLREAITYIFKLLFGQTGAKAMPADCNFDFNPLEVPSTETEKRTQLTQAQIDEIYMRNGVVDSFEVSQSRYGSGRYSYETNLDDSVREESDLPEPDMTEADMQRTIEGQ